MQTTAPYRYTAQLAGEIEEKWQAKWEETGAFHVANPVGDLAGEVSEDKLFLLDMFPFPSGQGLHVGHPIGYIATDVMARFYRMRGKNVLYTMGFDAFGLPTEQYAVQTGQHPTKTTANNIALIRKQLDRIGISHDKRRTVATTDVEFYKWTQWIFLQAYHAWYDDQAPGRIAGTVGRARPISELIEEFASGKRPIPDNQQWEEISVAEQEEILAQYRLAYLSDAPVNWCPGLGTVLSNEEVTNEGRSERGNFPVYKKYLKQWMMRITAYGERLDTDIEIIDWPDKVKSMQHHWIGKSKGAHVKFTVPGYEQPLVVFTTRPDTLFGATFMVVAPEHPILQSGIIPDEWPSDTRSQWTGSIDGLPSDTPQMAVQAYLAAAKVKSEAERGADTQEKTGVFSGIYAVNPVNGKQVPVFVADYVLWGYGTGAIMAVPAHDERDHAFAKKYDLDIIPTLSAEIDSEEIPDVQEQAWVGDGLVINSANDTLSLDGLDKTHAKQKMIHWLEEMQLGAGVTTYRLRDWIFSRQRYWGEPFPVVYDENGQVHALPESMLPIELPWIDDFSPRTYDQDDSESHPEPPLGRATDWVKVEIDLGDGIKTYTRDLNTMPNWAGSCWYEMRYVDPHNEQAFCDPQNEAYWMGPRPHTENHTGGADLYVGGVEHAVLHLLYSRFWHKLLFDLGYVSSSEPFHKIFNQGYVLAYAYTDSRGQYVPAAQVEEVPSSDGSGEVKYIYQGQEVFREYGKMGKSLKNMITPDEMCESYGADTFRVYEMSMGPLEISRPWETRAVVGAQRFLQRVWRNVIDEETGEVIVDNNPMDAKTARLVAKAEEEVRVELENMRINTAVAKLITLNNYLTGLAAVPREAMESIILMLSPLAPHICEELWYRLGHSDSLMKKSFPMPNPELLVEDKVICVVQVAGKLRDKIEVSASISEAEITALAIASEKAARFLGGKEPRKVIVRAPHLVNFVPQ